MRLLSYRRVASIVVAGLATFAMLGSGGAAFAVQPVAEVEGATLTPVCVSEETVYVTPESKAGWSLTGIGAAQFQREGLSLSTTGAKLSGLVDVNMDKSNACLPTMEYAGTGVQPGFNYVQVNSIISSTTLVYEPTAPGYGDNWWSSKALGVGGGMGYNSFAPLESYFDAGTITGFKKAGFSLGSGVTGEGVLKSITLGNTKYVFRDKAPLSTAVECVANETVYVTQDQHDGWSFAETKNGTYTFTKNGLALETTGGKVAGLTSINLNADNFCLPTMEYEGTGAHAGFNYRQLPDSAAGRLYAGLVYEPRSGYGEHWWSNVELNVGGGMGYTSYAPLSQYFDAGKISQIDVAGFALGTLGAGETASGILTSITQGSTKYVFTDKAPLPLATKCVAVNEVEVTPSRLQGWNFGESDLSKGSLEFTKDGLAIATTGGKIAGLVPVTLDQGNYCLPTMEYTGNSPVPGFNYRQASDPASGRAYAGLVYEPEAGYEEAHWWSNKDLGVGEGAGYASYALLSEYFDAGQISRINGAGFALGTLGEGASASGVLKSITLGDTKYTFVADPVVPPVAPSATVSDQKAQAGDTVTVSAVGFTAGEQVELWLNSKPAVSLGKFLVGADGNLSAKVKLPVGAAKGTYLIEVRGKNSQAATVSIVLEEAPVEPQACTKPRKVPVFADTPLAHKFYKEIDWMECMKYSTGWRQTTGKPVYKPADNLERQAMAAFIFRMEAPKGYKAPKVSPFTDVQTTDKFYKEIAWMWEAKLSTGYRESSGKPTYRPHDSLSREAMAAFIYRLESKTDAKAKTYQAPKVSPMADMDSGMKFYKEISWMYSEKLTTGNKVGATKEYWPKDDLSRQAMAAFIYRLVTDYRTAK